MVYSRNITKPTDPLQYVFAKKEPYVCTAVVRFREIGTGISEASKRDPIFLHDVRGGKQVSSYFRQRNWVQALEVRKGSDPAPCRRT